MSVTGKILNKRSNSAWQDVVDAVNESKTLSVVRFGDNMREVAVTEGDKVEAQMKFGWQVK